MWSSAMHFAIGFFGYPFEGQYEQSVTIEHDGVSLRSLFIIPTNVITISSTTHWHQKRGTSHTIVPRNHVSRYYHQLPQWK